MKLLNWGFRNTSTFEISKKGETSFELDAWLGRKDKIKATTNEDYYNHKQKDIRNLTVSLEYNGPVSAPIKKGEKIADIILKTRRNKETTSIRS